MDGDTQPFEATQVASSLIAAGSDAPARASTQLGDATEEEERERLLRAPTLEWGNVPAAPQATEEKTTPKVSDGAPKEPVSPTLGAIFKDADQARSWL